MIVRVAIVFLFALMPFFCFGATKVVVDTDMGVDDVMALAYLLKNPEADVKGICVSGTGISSMEAGSKAVFCLLKALNLEGKIPVWQGRKNPLAGSVRFPPEWGRGIIEFWKKQPPVSKKMADLNACARKIMDTEGKVMFLCLGPLTNLASLLRNYPELSKKIDSIVVMGGVINGAGNVERNGVFLPVEWNFYVDPEAVKTVLQSRIPVVIVPLDACDSVIFNKELFVNIFALPNTPQALFMKKFVRFFHHYLNSDGYCLWDPLAAVCALNPQVCDFESLRLDVVTQPSEQGRLLESKTGTKVYVAVSASRKFFEKEFLKALRARAD